MHAVGRRRVARKSPQEILRRAVRHILMQAQLGPFLREEKFAIFSGQMKRQFTKEENLAALKQLAIGPGARLALLAAHPARRQFVVFDINPRQVRHGSLPPVPLRAPRNRSAAPEYSTRRRLTN